MSITADSIVTWRGYRGVTRVGRVLGIHQGTAIIRDTDGVTHCVFADIPRPVQVPASTLRELGVSA